MVIRVYNKAYLYHFSVRIRHLQVLAIVFRRYRLLLLARIISLLSGTTGTRLWVSKKCSRPLGQTRSSVVGVTVFPFQQEERMVVLQNKHSSTKTDLNFCESLHIVFILFSKDTKSK